MLTPVSRLLSSGTAFLIAAGAMIATEKPAEAAARRMECTIGSWGLCASGEAGGGLGHEFGNYGGEYTCFPNTCHTSTYEGLCNQTHLDCNEW